MDSLMRIFDPHTCWRKPADFPKLCSSKTTLARNTTGNLPGNFLLLILLQILLCRDICILQAPFRHQDRRPGEFSVDTFHVLELLTRNLGEVRDSWYCGVEHLLSKWYSFTHVGYQKRPLYLYFSSFCYNVRQYCQITFFFFFNIYQIKNSGWQSP